MESATRPTTGADGPYWQAMAAGRLELPRCEDCGRWHWPAVFRCGSCGSWSQAWHSLAMQGQVFSYARSWHPFAGAEGIAVPYVSLVVELPQAGGRRVLGLLRGDERDLAIGAEVKGIAASTLVGETPIPAMHWFLNNAERGA
ncbi:MAG: hypothetical protein JWQ90_2607 [Hydrocarboniphaga sp.]|uniref:Zn-ribbon domain-containing OB-fold protein n=1 Tax=Hydrocarboniphaga sp. TaxID=2033016 RepID=UPI00262628DB|nr:zinc ribbon domain-containing protein [Hydrocarboniphaga sp.]MDB5970157.1 hypothetical protein [Hydrocarboniphaga sp.]